MKFEKKVILGSISHHKRLLIKKLLLLPLALFLTACFDDGSDLLIVETGTEMKEIQKYDRDLGMMMPDFISVGIIKITANAEKVTISNIKLNRGNCKLKSPLNSKTLKFGQSIKLEHTCDEVLEVDIKANGDEYTFEFDR